MAGDIKLKLELDLESLEHSLSEYRTAADRAHNSALNRAVSAVQTELVDRAYEKINLTKAVLKEKLSVNGAAGKITISGDAISLSRFLNTEPRKGKKSKGVTVKLWRDRAKVLYQGAFTAYGKNSSFHVFKRVGKARLPLKKLTGKGIRDMWEIPKFSDGIIDIANTTYQDRFISTFNAFVSKENG